MIVVVVYWKHCVIGIGVTGIIVTVYYWSSYYIIIGTELLPADPAQKYCGIIMVVKHTSIILCRDTPPKIAEVPLHTPELLHIPHYTYHTTHTTYT